MLPTGGLLGAVWFTNVCVFPDEAPIFGAVNCGDVASTAAPVPVTELTCVPLILNTFPAPPVSKVLLVSVSVVARATSVSVLFGTVTVAVPAVAIKVLPLIFMVLPAAVSRILLLSVSVVARPTSVSVDVGKDKAPPLLRAATFMVPLASFCAPLPIAKVFALGREIPASHATEKGSPGVKQ